MPHLLLIEDDPEIGALLRLNLEREGYRVTWCQDGKSGLLAASRPDTQLILLDLMLPMLDGIHLLKRLRSAGIETPVIIVSAKGSEHDKLAGFRAGCDDYLSKPFSLMELLARVRAVLKRSGWIEHRPPLRSHSFYLDPAVPSLTHDQRDIPLSPQEFRLLYALMSHPGQALARSFLLDQAWGDDVDVTDRTVDTHIASLRKKLEEATSHPSLITTVYKVGYRWES